MNWKKADLSSVEFNILRDTEVDPPIEKLYFSGVMPDLENSIAVVGSRKISEYGKRVCREFVGVLAEAGITIISGLMYGVDMEAHNSALNAGGKTVGVLGYGANFLYQYRYAHDLYKRILETKAGSIVSEYEPDEPAAQWTFPKRNRIIAALSKATLVIEAAENSGSLITAGYAVEQGKDVFAVPGSIYSPNSAGTNWLIKQGAAVATSPEDILMYFGKSGRARGSCNSDDKEFLDLIESLGAMATPAKIAEIKGLSPGKVSAKLSEMELAGYISKDISGRFHVTL